MPRVRSTFRTLIKVESQRTGTCGSSHLSIAAHVGWDPMTVSRIWNRWVQNVLMDCAAKSRALRQELGLFSEQQVPAQTFRRRLQQH
ncbi:hypothetical protein TNCV_2866231 [Trichonephila clavipes]|nr:hypothetical protein TNCV_2866231 [Trichonephila clavipes]